MELYTRYTLTTKHGFISESGVYLIIGFVNRQDLQSEDWKAVNPASVRTFLPPLPSDWDWEWIVTKGDYRGALPKRVSSYYAKTYSIKCPTKFITEIGNIAKSHTSESQSYTFEFVDEIDWDAGEFGEDESSCYWNEYAGARQMITDNGGLAVRFYSEHDRGIARAWMAKIGDGLWVLWNGYGFSGNSTLTIARIVATHLGLTYKRIDLVNHYNSYSILYINGGIGYVIGTQAKIELISRHDFKWQEIEVRTCYECGDELGSEDDWHYGTGDNIYCRHCYERLFDTCSHCGETHWLEDLHVADYDVVCDYCLARHYVQCDECGEYVRTGDSHTKNDKTYCESCYEDDAEEIDDE